MSTPTNRERAQAARAALAAYKDAKDSRMPHIVRHEDLIDLLADLRHLAAQPLSGLDFDAAVGSSSYHFAAEVDEA
jgi:hypothetical protein